MPGGGKRGHGRSGGHRGGLGRGEGRGGRRERGGGPVGIAPISGTAGCLAAELAFEVVEFGTEAVEFGDEVGGAVAWGEGTGVEAGGEASSLGAGDGVVGGAGM